MLNGNEAQYTNAQVSKFSMQAFGAAVVIALRDKFCQTQEVFQQHLPVMSCIAYVLQAVNHVYHQGLCGICIHMYQLCIVS